MKKLKIIIEPIDRSNINIQEDLALASKENEKDFILKNAVGVIKDDKDQRTDGTGHNRGSRKGSKKPSA